MNAAKPYRIFNLIFSFNIIIGILLLFMYCFCDHASFNKPCAKNKTSTSIYNNSKYKIKPELGRFLWMHENTRKASTHNTSKILCFVLTEPANLETKAIVVYDTWAKKCDTVKFVSVVPHESHSGEKRIETLYQNKLPLLQPTGHVTESYGNLTDKVFKTLIDLYRTYSTEYDWFLKADDDTFVFVENLRSFLARKNPDKLTYFGCNLKQWVAGGAGYVLSRAALRKLASALINRPRMFFYSGTVNYFSLNLELLITFIKINVNIRK
jgi:hypothetical protein